MIERYIYLIINASIAGFPRDCRFGQMELNSIEVAVMILSSTVRSGTLDKSHRKIIQHHWVVMSILRVNSGWRHLSKTVKSNDLKSWSMQFKY